MVANESVMLPSKGVRGTCFCECTVCMPFRCVSRCVCEGEGKCILP